MNANLIAELVKIGVKPNQVAKDIAKVLDISEKSARNKINEKTDWTVPEAVKINDHYFNGGMSIPYLFESNNHPAA